MALFQCQKCGVVENTALAHQGFIRTHLYDWTGKEALRGLRLCCECGPTQFKSGKQFSDGKWHDEFSKTYLPPNTFEDLFTQDDLDQLNTA